MKADSITILLNLNSLLVVGAVIEFSPGGGTQPVAKVLKRFLYRASPTAVGEGR